MPHTKHTTEETLTVVIQTLIDAVGFYLRHPDDETAKRILDEVIAHARNMVTPQEFKAERCPDTPDFFPEDET